MTFPLPKNFMKIVLIFNILIGDLFAKEYCHWELILKMMCF